MVGHLVCFYSFTITNDIIFPILGPDTQGTLEEKSLCEQLLLGMKRGHSHCVPPAPQGRAHFLPPSHNCVLSDLRRVPSSPLTLARQFRVWDDIHEPTSAGRILSQVPALNGGTTRRKIL